MQKKSLVPILAFSIVSIALYGCSASGAISKPNKVKTSLTQTNTAPQDYKRYLFFSVGDIHFRRLTEAVYDEMAKEITFQEAYSKFYFLDNEHGKADKQLRDIASSEKYDAIIFMIPTDTAFVKEIISFFYGPMPGSPFAITMHERPKDVRLKQKAQFVLCDSPNRDNPVWSMSMEMDLRFYKSSGAKKISKKVLKSLKANNILNKYPSL